MNNYEDWALLVAKKLKGEADLIAAIEKDELDDTAATDAFVRAVLEPFLPENYGIGSGRIVDAFGNYSDHIEVIVYNRDFPRIGMRGTHDAYLYESVLATFSVRAKFIRKTFFESLDACASLAQLDTNMDKTVLIKLAKKNGLKPGPNKRFVHQDPLRTARFDLIGRPPGFVFGFSGIKNSYRQLQENIELWIDHRQNDGITTSMKALPAVIATQGCFAWRNAAPLALSNREMLGIGNDDAPIRLIVLQMLYLLNRRLHVTADGYGLKPNLNAYLSQFSAPKFEIGVGDVSESAIPPKASRDTMRFKTAKDHTKDETPAVVAAPEVAQMREIPEPPPAPEKAAPVSETPEPPSTLVKAAPVSETPEPSPALVMAAPVSEAPEPPPAPVKAAPVNKTPEPPPAPVKAAPVSEAPEPPPAPVKAAPVNETPEPPPAPKKAAPVSEIKEPSTQAAMFDNPSPFASAPSPAAEAAAPQDATPAPAAEAAVFDKPSPFASAPLPKVEEPEPPKSTAAVSSLGSAPIPTMSSPTPAAEPEPAPPPTTPLGSAPIPQKEPEIDKVIPPKPPVDFDLGSDSEELEDKVQTEEDEFENTVIIPPNAGASSNDAAQNSTNAFIARVKDQLSSPPEPATGKK